jgi:hypothetical protein
MKLLQLLETSIGQFLTACNRRQDKRDSNGSAGIMAIPLENCTREKKHSVIRFLCSEGVKARDIQQYDGSCMGERKVYQWIERFQEGPSSVGDAGKHMLTSWHMNEPVLERYQQKGETVNSVRYRTTLEGKLEPAIRNRRRGFVSNGVLLLHDNA